MPKPINISASRGAAVLGVSKWNTPVNVWLEIMESREPGFCEVHGYTMPEFEYNAAMRWGHAFESAIVELADTRDGLICCREDFCTHKKYDYITCHIDGAYDDGKSYPLPLHEGKTTSLFYFNSNFGEPGTDKVPIEYQIQCQHQMICTGADKVILSVLVFPKRVEEWEEMGWVVSKDKGGYFLYHPKEDDKIYPEEWAGTLSQMSYFHQYEITANKELHEIMIKYYSEFWGKNVLGKTPPRPQTHDDIKALVREPIGTIIATPEITGLSQEYKEIKKEIGKGGDLAKRCDIIKTKVLDYMRKSSIASECPIDDDSVDKWILRDQQGNKLFQWDGKAFR